MSTDPVRLGFLYPGHAAEDDYPWLADKLQPPADAVVVHTSVGEDAHRADALLDLGSEARLLEGASRLEPSRPAAAIWACTSGSFVFGWEGARNQVDLLRRSLGIPCSSTSFSFVAAAKALGLARVALGATYPEDVSELFAKFLSTAGIATVRLSSFGIVTAVEVGTLGREEVLEIARGSDSPDADAVFMPDTALHSARWLEEIEAAVAKPVITANQATIWHAWQLSGQAAPVQRLGALFDVVAGPEDLATEAG